MAIETKAGSRSAQTHTHTSTKTHNTQTHVHTHTHTRIQQTLCNLSGRQISLCNLASGHLGNKNIICVRVRLPPSLPSDANPPVLRTQQLYFRGPSSTPEVTGREFCKHFWAGYFWLLGKINLLGHVTQFLIPIGSFTNVKKSLRISLWSPLYIHGTNHWSFKHFILFVGKVYCLTKKLSNSSILCIWEHRQLLKMFSYF